MQRRDFLNTSFALGVSTLAASRLNAQDASDAQSNPNSQTAPLSPSLPTAPSEDDLLRGKRPGFPKIKIAQIGVRHEHASGKMNTMKMAPDYFEIVGIAAESPQYQAQHEGKGVYRDLKWYSQDALLDIPGLEAVCVETEMTELLPTAMKCAERGLHMHIDKPLGQNLDELKQLIEVCRQKNVIVQPGYMFRTNQAFRLLLKAVRNGWLGEIHDVQLDMCRNDVSPGFRKWLATYRGGGMYDFGSHLIDFVYELLGPPEEIHVFEKPDPTDNLSDNTLSVMLYPKAIAQVRVSLRKIDGFARRRMVCHGTKGSFIVDPIESWSRDPNTKRIVPLNVTLTLDEPHEDFKKGVNTLKIQPYEDRYLGQMTDFAMFIRGEKENPYSYEYEIGSQKAILAASGYVPWEK